MVRPLQEQRISTDYAQEFVDQLHVSKGMKKLLKLVERKEDTKSVVENIIENYPFFRGYLWSKWIVSLGNAQVEFIGTKIILLITLLSELIQKDEKKDVEKKDSKKKVFSHSSFEKLRLLLHDDNNRMIRDFVAGILYEDNKIATDFSGVPVVLSDTVKDLDGNIIEAARNTLWVTEKMKPYEQSFIDFHNTLASLEQTPQTYLSSLTWIESHHLAELLEEYKSELLTLIKAKLRNEKVDFLYTSWTPYATRKTYKKEPNTEEQEEEDSDAEAKLETKTVEEQLKDLLEGALSSVLSTDEMDGKRREVFENYGRSIVEYIIARRSYEKYGFVPTNGDKELMDDMLSFLDTDKRLFLTWPAGSWKTQLAMTIARSWHEIKHSNNADPFLFVMCDRSMTAKDLQIEKVIGAGSIIDLYNPDTQESMAWWWAQLLADKITSERKFKEELVASLIEWWMEEKEAEGYVSSLNQQTSTQVKIIATGILKAMQEGKVIILDEYNMLSEETKVGLNKLLERKVWEEFTMFGQTITVKDWFGIIMTGNTWDKFHGRTTDDSSWTDRILSRKKDLPRGREMKQIITQMIIKKAHQSRAWLQLQKYQEEDTLDVINTLWELSDRIWSIGTTHRQDIATPQWALDFPSSNEMESLWFQLSLRGVGDIVSDYVISPYPIETLIITWLIDNKNQYGNEKQAIKKTYRLLVMCHELWLFEKQRQDCQNEDGMKDVVNHIIQPYTKTTLNEVSKNKTKTLRTTRDELALNAYHPELLQQPDTIKELFDDTKTQEKIELIKNKEKMVNVGYREEKINELVLHYANMNYTNEDEFIGMLVYMQQIWKYETLLQKIQKKKLSQLEIDSLEDSFGTQNTPKEYDISRNIIGHHIRLALDNGDDKQFMRIMWWVWDGEKLSESRLWSLSIPQSMKESIYLQQTAKIQKTLTLIQKGKKFEAWSPERIINSVSALQQYNRLYGKYKTLYGPDHYSLDTLNDLFVYVKAVKSISWFERDTPQEGDVIQKQESKKQAREKLLTAQSKVIDIHLSDDDKRNIDLSVFDARDNKGSLDIQSVERFLWESKTLQWQCKHVYAGSVALQLLTQWNTHKQRKIAIEQRTYQAEKSLTSVKEMSENLFGKSKKSPFIRTLCEWLLYDVLPDIEIWLTNYRDNETMRIQNNHASGDVISPSTLQQLFGQEISDRSLAVDVFIAKHQEKIDGHIYKWLKEPMMKQINQISWKNVTLLESNITLSKLQHIINPDNNKEKNDRIKELSKKLKPQIIEKIQKAITERFETLLTWIKRGDDAWCTMALEGYWSYNRNVIHDQTIDDHIRDLLQQRKQDIIAAQKQWAEKRLQKLLKNIENGYQGSAKDVNLHWLLRRRNPQWDQQMEAYLKQFYQQNNGAIQTARQKWYESNLRDNKSNPSGLSEGDLKRIYWIEQKRAIAITVDKMVKNYEQEIKEKEQVYNVQMETDKNVFYLHDSSKKDNEKIYSVALWYKAQWWSIDFDKTTFDIDYFDGDWITNSLHATIDYKKLAERCKGLKFLRAWKGMSDLLPIMIGASKNLELVVLDWAKYDDTLLYALSKSPVKYLQLHDPDNSITDEYINQIAILTDIIALQVISKEKYWAVTGMNNTIVTPSDWSTYITLYKRKNNFWDTKYMF